METTLTNNEHIGDHLNDAYFCLHEDGVCLLPFGADELYSENYLRWMNDPEVTKTLGRFDYLMPVDREKLVDYYNGINKTNTIFLAIYLRSDGFSSQAKKINMKFIGTVKIYDIDLLPQRASIGIAIGDKLEWGKGYAGKAIRIASRYIFEVLGLRKITAGYIANNIGMERAFLKNDFEIEAIFKQHVYYEGQFVDHKFVCKFRN